METSLQTKRAVRRCEVSVDAGAAAPSAFFHQLRRTLLHGWSAGGADEDRVLLQAPRLSC